MVGSQKILTVSYGTFSCTLEGFEDSFGTMKAIAEYFRDLAAEDRHFGAEPPVPDAAMLAGIAEREAARRVEARLERTGPGRVGPGRVGPGRVGPEQVSLVLRVDEGATGGLATGSPATGGSEAAAAAAGPAMPPPPPLAPLARAAQDEGVVAKLARIRAVVGRSDLVSAEEEPGHAEPAGAERAAGGAEAARRKATGPEALPLAGAAPRMRADAPLGATGADATPTEDEEGVGTAPSAVAHLSPRVVLMRRAGPEGEAGSAPLAAPDDALPAAGPPPGDAAPSTESGLTPEAEAELMAELAALEAALGAAAPSREAPQVPASGDAAEAAVAGLLAALDGARGPDPSPAAPAGPGAIGATAEARAGDAPSREEPAASAPADMEPVAEPEPLEAVRADAAAEPASEELAWEPAWEPARPRGLAAAPAGDEAAVSRLLSRADEQLAEPEASRRREAIAQLRAAVAATEAARRQGAAAPEPPRREDPFRDDLRHVVRPRRPMAAEMPAGARAERPRPAPLRLVASQRVDLPGAEGAWAEPVRPRRVSPDAAPDPRPGTPSDASFAAFAAEMGAVSLTDILEAAAAFTSFVEGAEDFSRPQLLDRVRQATPAGFSREDGLRSFGTLLRQGTITRVRGGRFQVTGESRFNPARRAG